MSLSDSSDLSEHKDNLSNFSYHIVSCYVQVVPSFCDTGGLSSHDTMMSQFTKHFVLDNISVASCNKMYQHRVCVLKL